MISLFHGYISTLFYNILSFGRENKLEQGSDLCFVLCIIIVVEGADDGISLVGGVLYGRGGIVLAIIRDGQSLDARRHISEPYIADCPFGLADRLDNSSGGGHGETAAHIILVLEVRSL